MSQSATGTGALDKADFQSRYAANLTCWEHVVRCPTKGCQQEYSHIHAVVVNRGGVLTEIRGGDDPKTVTSFPTGRGSSVWVECVCETGHLWALRLQFHKGQMFIQCEAGATIEERDWPACFWRD